MFAGKCTNLDDMCASIADEEECEAQMSGTGNKLCSMVDRCESNLCSEGDQCCGVSRDMCRGEFGCAPAGGCRIRTDNCML